MGSWNTISKGLLIPLLIFFKCEKKRLFVSLRNRKIYGLSDYLSCVYCTCECTHNCYFCTRDCVLRRKVFSHHHHHQMGWGCR